MFKMLKAKDPYAPLRPPVVSGVSIFFRRLLPVPGGLFLVLGFERPGLVQASRIVVLALMNKGLLLG